MGADLSSICRKAVGYPLKGQNVNCKKRYKGDRLWAGN